MIADKKQEALEPLKLRRMAMYFLPAATVVCIVAAVIYRIEMFYWPEDISDRVLEWVILSVCIALLLVLFLIGSWLLVRTQISEKSMRADLARNEARLKALFQTIPDLIWLKNEQGVYLACNPAFERFFGATESEIAGKTDYDFVDADLADSFRANDLAALAAGKARVNEEWITLADDGRRVLLETIKAPVKTEADDLIGVMGIARDITRRYEAENEASLFRNLVEFSGDPIYVMDRSDYHMVFVNQAACNHFGASRDEIAKWTVFDWDPDITKEAIEANTSIFESGDNAHFETRHKTASGKVIPVEVTVNKLFLSDGRNLGGGYIRNISERKRAEEVLRQSHQQLLNLTSNVPGVVYQYQLFPDGRFSIPFISSTVEELYGLTPGAIYSDPSLPFIFTHPDDVEKLDISIKESAKTMLPWHCEYRLVLPNIGIRWVLGNSRPELQEDGSLIWHGFITDITEVKKIQESLQNSREQLRQLMAHQDRIREDERKRIAREIHDELGQYLLALRIDVSMLSKLQVGTHYSGELVDDILQQIDSTMKKVRAIINNLRPSVLDLGVFAALEWQMNEFERRSGIKCQLVGNEDDLGIEERLATTLFRVMQEALTNVQRHANATRVKITIQRKGDDLNMEIADNGVGISDEAHTGQDRFGLMGIRERIAMLGGQTIIEDRDGTVLTVSIPAHSSGDSLMH